MEALTPTAEKAETAQLRQELAGARQTISMLMDRLEKSDSQSPSANVLNMKSMALQEIVRQRTKSLEQMNTGLLQASIQRKRIDRILKEMQRIASIGGWELDVESGKMELTEQVLAILAMPPGGNLTVGSLGETFTQEGGAELGANIEAACREQKAFDLELESTREHQFFRVVGHPLVEGGRVARIYGVIQDITARKQAEADLERANKQLIAVSRQAGMAEVATGVLHNVGNVLNSVNVSSSLISDGVKKSKVASVGKLATLLKEHEADLGAFITSNPKGKMVPGFVSQLAQHLADEQSTLLKELEHLHKNVEHIREIVNTQQTYASSAGFVEPLDVRESIEDALRMNLASLTRHGIEVVRNFAAIHPVPADKHKVLQILVNLIRNAREAMSNYSTRCLTVTVRPRPDGGVCVSVTDTGCGIATENTTRVFAHGFTTKKEGHGFGLHSSALAAREMKGSLTVQSEGEGRGATFTLELPAAIPTALLMT